MRTRKMKADMKAWQTLLRRHISRVPKTVLSNIYNSIPARSNFREPGLAIECATEELKVGNVFREHMQFAKICIRVSLRK